MLKNYYSSYLRGKGNIKILSKKHNFYRYIKEEFFDFGRSKWKVGLYKEYIVSNNLNYNVTYAVLKEFSESNFIINTVGSKGFISFVKRIEKLNKTDKENESLKISIKGDSKSFLRELSVLRERYLDMNNEEYFSFIDDNFIIGFTKNTIRNYYNERKFSD